MWMSGGAGTWQPGQFSAMDCSSQFSNASSAHKKDRATVRTRGADLFFTETRSRFAKAFQLHDGPLMPKGQSSSPALNHSWFSLLGLACGRQSLMIA
ncbi:MAG: hypothetical protein CBB71_02965 [Rhodopirellula sp. TMED11]|nr:MAG: hypothetical protein CBB71_02965 [Rhodopirellula sp. TMED11]